MARTNGSTPVRVVDGIVQDIAKVPPGRNVPISKIAEEWGVTKFVAEKIAQRSKVDIAEYRKMYSEIGFENGIALQLALGQKLLDPAEMAKTPVRDLALAAEKTINSAVTAQDGHAPAVALNFGFISQQMANLQKYDASAERDRLEQRRRELADKA